MLNELWVEEGESGELVLVEVHHEELVGGGELGALAGELPVEVGDVLPVALACRRTYSSWVEPSAVTGSNSPLTKVKPSNSCPLRLARM